MPSVPGRKRRCLGAARVWKKKKQKGGAIEETVAGKTQERNGTDSLAPIGVRTRGFAAKTTRRAFASHTAARNAEAAKRRKERKARLHR